MTDAGRLGFIETLASFPFLREEEQKIITHLASGGTWDEFSGTVNNVPKGGHLVAQQAYDAVVSSDPVDALGHGLFETVLERPDLNDEERKLFEHLVAGGTWDSIYKRNGHQNYFAPYALYDGVIQRHRQDVVAA